MQNDQQHERLDERLRAAAATFPYPPTPDVVAALRSRRDRPAPAHRRWRPAARLAAALALLLIALLGVPELRAAALQLIQIGVVRVRVEPGSAPTALQGPGALPAPGPSPAAAPRLSLPDLAGATTLEEAAGRAAVPVRLPAYPADLGPPAAVFLQELDGAALVLVWADPADPARPRLSLHALSSRGFAEKLIYTDQIELIAETEVGGARALWVKGPHMLRVGPPPQDGYLPVRLVEGNTLIWTAGGVTYRMESDLSLEEARRVAESLRPFRP